MLSTRRLVVCVASIVLVAMLTLPDAEAQADCWTCEPVLNCFFAQNGFYDCVDQGDGCVLTGFGCMSGFVMIMPGKVRFDGTLGPDSDLQPQAQSDAGQSQQLETYQDPGPNGAAYRRGCHGVIVARTYATETGSAMRRRTQTIGV